jgi:hypothetical protein
LVYIFCYNILFLSAAACTTLLSEVENGPELTIYCVTESVMPLEEHLKDLPAGTHQRDEYFALGLR